MRKEFSSWCEENLVLDKHVFLTGDLGFMALENVREKMGDRFINMGVAEQNMMSVAAGMASEGLIPLCYSIAPFCVFRPAEQIRLDICLHDHNVKLVGNGGGYGYGIMGASHHAIEDYGMLSSFQSMRCFIPMANSEVSSACFNMYNYQGPSYLRLGNAVVTNEHRKRFDFTKKYSAIYELCSGENLVVMFVGPVGVNVLDSIIQIESDSKTRQTSIAVYVVQEIPILNFPENLLGTIRKSGQLLIVEEHVSRGSFGELMALELLKRNINTQIHHLHAIGYPDKKYGSQKFHQQQSGLDINNIKKKIIEVISAKL
ncbi:MAG: hypothetical protein QE271_07100 [Bacteriovoracaceae bacterium]|nr:hypothetical protein [Bacteriovoracaceae bacterium]